MQQIITALAWAYLPLRIHHKKVIALDSIEEHPISFFALSERVIPQPTSFLHLRQMLFRLLAPADVADRRRHQNFFGAFQRAQHNLDGKLAAIFPPPDKLDPRADLLCQRVRRASRTVGDEPFSESLRNDVLHLLPY